MTDEELRKPQAGHVAAEHDPKNQNHGYERCALCGYVRHPCDTYDLAVAVLDLLDRVAI